MNALEASARRAAVCLLLLLGMLGLCAPAAAQETGPQPVAPAAETDAPIDPVTMAEAALAAPAEADKTDQPPAEDLTTAETPQINILELLAGGGILMYPIGLMSLLVVTFGVERMLGLRRHKVLPPELIQGLGTLAGQKGGLDPRQAYKLCQQYPSTAATVIKAMLLKIGRPHTEVEHTVAEANEREAARLYANVRWLSLAAGITPLLGLLGTVQGMIMAFFNTANMPTGVNKAEFLAKGIYVALVTTFAGLSVAIPAAVLAHLFEGRIQKLFREMDETLLGMLPQLERFEGRLRVSKDQLDTAEAAAAAPRKQPAATPQ